MAEIFREPQSANEALLQNILGANNEIREPQSVTEYYLKKIWEEGAGGGGGVNKNTVDLLVFAGQSNMAGRGTGANAPKVSPNAGMEFRPITDPTHLHEIDEGIIPFGRDENSATLADGINDLTSGGTPAKTGSLVPAFINAYYANTGVKVIGVSASKGSTSSAAWIKANRGLYAGLIARYNSAKEYLINNGYTIRRKLVVWLQGEQDGSSGETAENYIANTNHLFNDLIKGGTDLEKMLVIRIGHFQGDTKYDTIMAATNTLCESTNNIEMISTKLGELSAASWYKGDSVHFNQAGLNTVGTDAGTRAAKYVNTGIQPIMYDTLTQSIFIKKISEVLEK